MRFWREIICNKQREKRAEIFLVTCDKIIICAEVEALQKIKSLERFAPLTKMAPKVLQSLHRFGYGLVGGMKK